MVRRPDSAGTTVTSRLDARRGDDPAQSSLRSGVLTVAAWAAVAGLLVLCGEGVKRSPALLELDRTVMSFVVDHRTPGIDQAMRVVTVAGSWIAALALAVVVLVLVVAHGLPAAVAVAVPAAWIGELLAVTLAKEVVQRPRPPEHVQHVGSHGWSFPSGHSATAVVVFLMTATLVTAVVVRRVVRLLMWALCALMALLVGFSRIELGVHWTTDVLASLIWTSCWVAVVVSLLGPVRALRWAASDRTAPALGRDDAPA